MAYSLEARKSVDLLKKMSITTSGTIQEVLNRAADFVWKGLNAIVHLLKTSYEKGIKVCGKEKTKMEERQQRSERLPLYDITIIPKTVY